MQRNGNILNGYRKIRVVGKGAFGTAILYHKLSEDVLVVMKEVNMTELTVVERQAALNEVQVLSVLHHPNIISYMGSHEHDGVLMIEMEYADGGTLAQMLAQQTMRLPEREILTLFQQIVSAIHYMHQHNILHRDLKTANVFLTKRKAIKVGDFGISKVMSTRGQAHTVLGTPYYISPEMCEGKQYGEKSDIWALGCILYEMAGLQKPFEGSNLPALVNKIMKGQFQPLPFIYSIGLRKLVNDLLKKDPMLRPSAGDIIEFRIPPLLEAAPDLPNHNTRSVLYELCIQGQIFSMKPIQLPVRIQIKEVAVGKSHVVAITSEFVAYAWGDNNKGQLGIGDSKAWTHDPTCVDTLKGTAVHRVGAGDAYSIFVIEPGMLMTCGEGSAGCLGHGDWNNGSQPKLIEKLESVNIVQLSCAPKHVCALSKEGHLYTWGKGADGSLCLGSLNNYCMPQQVPLPLSVVITVIRTGVDCTAVITVDGLLMACGRNTQKKLGTISKEGDISMSLKQVKCVNGKVIDASFGITHSAILIENGSLVTLGCNYYGQLGHGHTKPSDPGTVKTMADKVITMVQCGPSYTVVGTNTNAVYLWGSQFVLGTTMVGSQENLSNQQFVPVLEPQEILALYASKTQIEKGQFLSLAAIYLFENGIMILVDTTAPIAQLEENDSNEISEASSIDTEMPDWIKVELATSENSWKALL